MRRITRILTGMTFAAGTLGAGAAMALTDEYGYTQPDTYSEYSQPGNYSNSYTPAEREMPTDRDSRAFVQPGATYYNSSPRTYYYRSETYAPTYGYTPYAGYYDNPYNPTGPTVAHWARARAATCASAAK